MLSNSLVSSSTSPNSAGSDSTANSNPNQGLFVPQSPTSFSSIDPRCSPSRRSVLSTSSNTSSHKNNNGNNNINNNNNSNYTHTSNKYGAMKYKGKPLITEVPELLELCNEFIRSKNVTGLAMIARQRGLPPSLRYKIWPILLKYHPFVQNPFIEPDEDEDDEEEEDDDNGEDAEDANETHIKIPINQIKFDLRKYLRNAERYKPKILTSELKDLFEIQDKMLEIILNSIIKFLKKWGTLINYNSGLTWIALGLAEWVPALPNSQFVLCGKDDVAKNGTKLRNVNDNYFERMDNDLMYSSSLNSTSAYNSNTASNFSSSPKSINSVNGSTSSTGSEIYYDPAAYPYKPMLFSELYERMVLVILHIPNPAKLKKLKQKQQKEQQKLARAKLHEDKKEKKYTDLPKNGGNIEDLVSFFLYCLRKLLPELHKFLVDEDCLKGDWLIWWLKYCGSKVFSRYDRSRVWDILLGYRVDFYKFERDLKQLNELTDEQVALLGPDIFWNPLDVDIDSPGNNYHGRSSSVRTLFDQLNITPTLPSQLSPLNNNDVEPIKKLPYSEMDPHVQFIFIALAFLKSKEFTIMELDQSDIKQLLNNISSLKTSEIRSLFAVTASSNDSQAQTDTAGSSVTGSPPKTSKLNEDIFSNPTVSGGSGPSATDNSTIQYSSASSEAGDLSSISYPVQHQLHHQSKKSNRDIENIIVEAGELWRRFAYMEAIEEDEE